MTAERQSYCPPTFPLFLLVFCAVAMGGFLGSPTIDFDEGFFFQSSVHATQTGLPGFPWSDFYFEGTVPYIPLNSLLPLVNLPLAYLPYSIWLPAGRLVSVVAVVSGLGVLLYAYRLSAKASRTNYYVAAFALLCYPLWLHGRMIRPEALVFFTFCLSLAMIQSAQPRAAFVAGISSGMGVLAHTIQGSLAVLVVAAGFAAMGGVNLKQRCLRLLLLCVGLLLPVFLFYAWYVSLVGFAGVERQIALFAALTPRSVMSNGPSENFAAWFAHTRSQLNVVPLLGLAALGWFAPVRRDDPARHTIRVYQTALVVFMIFWIFVYPKKAFSPVVILLPLSYVILRAAPFERVGSKLMATGICACLAVNSLLLLRYHWKLLHSPNGMEQIAPIVEKLRDEGVIFTNARIMAKVWLHFGLPADVKVWDVCVFPAMMRQLHGEGEGLMMAIQNSDAVVLEFADGSWLDDWQEHIAMCCRGLGWKEVTVQTSHYFKPITIVIFYPRVVASRVLKTPEEKASM